MRHLIKPNTYKPLNEQGLTDRWIFYVNFFYSLFRAWAFGEGTIFRTARGGIGIAHVYRLSDKGRDAVQVTQRLLDQEQQETK